MNLPIFTQKGFDDMLQEKKDLVIARKAAVIDLKKAREMGDLSENGYYKAARFKLNDIDRRIRFLTHLLKEAQVQQIVTKETIDIGCTVEISDGQRTKTYLLLGGFESNPAEGKLSIISPIGKAMLGKKQGDTFSFESPNGNKQYSILSVVYR